MDMALVITDGGATVGNGYLAAVSGNQQCMVGQADNNALAKYPVNRVFHRIPGFFIDDVKNIVQRMTAGFIIFPAGKLFSYGIHQFNLALHIRGDYCIPDALQRGTQLFFNHRTGFVSGILSGIH